jgi:hypothetical protein
MKRPLLKKYIDTMTDIKGYCNSSNLLNTTGHKRELDYIKHLQLMVQSVSIDYVFSELYDTTSDVKDDICMALESYEQQTKDILFHAEISGTDYMDVGDSEVLKHFTDIAVKNKGRKDYLTEDEAAECVLRLHNILEWCNDMNKSFMEKWQAAYKYATNKKSNSGNGSKRTFRDIIQYENKDKLLKRLHSLIDGKGGADVGAILYKAYIDNYIYKKPSQKEFESEFELIGSWQGISNYMIPSNNLKDARSSDITIF